MSKNVRYNKISICLTMIATKHIQNLLKDLFKNFYSLFRENTMIFDECNRACLIIPDSLSSKLMIKLM